MRLWIFVGSVPEDGDMCMVWGKDEKEAMLAGRKVMGYGDPEYDDENEFSVHEASLEEVVLFGEGLLCHQAGYPFVPPEFREGGIRDVIAERLRALHKHPYHFDQTAHRNGDLARAAAFFATPDPVAPEAWPAWIVNEHVRQREHGQTRRDELVRAAAFLIAEIDRLDAEAAVHRQYEAAMATTEPVSG